jgi:hypothetical protein
MRFCGGQFSCERRGLREDSPDHRLRSCHGGPDRTGFFQGLGAVLVRLPKSEGKPSGLWQAEVLTISATWRRRLRTGLAGRRWGKEGKAEVTSPPTKGPAWTDWLQLPACLGSTTSRSTPHNISSPISRGAGSGRVISIKSYCLNLLYPKDIHESFRMFFDGVRALMFSRSELGMDSPVSMATQSKEQQLFVQSSERSFAAPAPGARACARSVPSPRGFCSRSYLGRVRWQSDLGLGAHRRGDLVLADSRCPLDNMPTRSLLFPEWDITSSSPPKTFLTRLSPHPQQHFTHTFWREFGMFHLCYTYFPVYYLGAMRSFKSPFSYFYLEEGIAKYLLNEWCMIL